MNAGSELDEVKLPGTLLVPAKIEVVVSVNAEATEDIA